MTWAATPAMGSARDAAADESEVGALSSANNTAAESKLRVAAAGESSEWWWYSWTQMENVECKVGHGSQTGDLTGFEVWDTEECARECDYTDWCESFSVDIVSDPQWCFLLGDLDPCQCYPEMSDIYDT